MPAFILSLDTSQFPARNRFLLQAIIILDPLKLLLTLG
jgi:hypothetical protein